MVRIRETNKLMAFVYGGDDQSLYVKQNVGGTYVPLGITTGTKTTSPTTIQAPGGESVFDPNTAIGGWYAESSNTLSQEYSDMMDKLLAQREADFQNMTFENALLENIYNDLDDARHYGHFECKHCRRVWKTASSFHRHVTGGCEVEKVIHALEDEGDGHSSGTHSMDTAATVVFARNKAIDALLGARIKRKRKK